MRRRNWNVDNNNFIFHIRYVLGAVHVVPHAIYSSSSSYYNYNEIDNTCRRPKQRAQDEQRIGNTTNAIVMQSTCVQVRASRAGKCINCKNCIAARMKNEICFCNNSDSLSLSLSVSLSLSSAPPPPLLCLHGISVSFA